jgi:oligosaccharide repeat unit polymerase
MWRTILRPDVLFTIATVQALSPYVFWRFGIGEFRGQASLTYIPVIIWLCGWLAFMFGTLIPNSGKTNVPAFEISPSETTLKIATLILMAVICAQLVSLVHLYGAVPIMSYLKQDGAIDIGTAVSLQEESGVGQVGSVYVTTAVLHGLVLLLIIRNLEQGRRDQLLILVAFVVLIAAHAINAKRQGFVRCAVFLLTGLSLYTGSPVNAIARATKLVRTRLSASVALALTAILLFASFGYLAYVRNQGHYTRGSLEELIAYQEFSLVNFETQCAQQGLGPYQRDYFAWMRRLIPFKLMDALGFEEREMPARYEPWAPAGLYEDLQWSLGLFGVVSFSFVLGLFTMWCYRQALMSPFFLLAYCQISFSLMLAHSFNEFVSLSWIPAPLVLFLVLCGTLRTRRTQIQIPVGMGPAIRMLAGEAHR